MGKSRYKIYDTVYPHFVTATFVEWLPLFSDNHIATICLNSLKYLQEHENLQLYGWVFMENHMHLIVRSKDLSRSMARFKSFSAKQIVAYLDTIHRTATLERLAWAKTRHKLGQNFQVWQEGVHPEQIVSREMMIQKLEYIHFNPIRRGYVDSPESWKYSSCRNYMGKEGVLSVCTSWY